MRYVDHGEGMPVVMLHGNPTWSFMYRNLITELSSNGLRCITPDHLGCGLSDKPQTGFAYTLAAHADNIAALIDALALQRFHLVVHDWGGAIGMDIAERFSERLQRIQIFNTGAWPSRRIPWSIALCKTPFLGELLIRGLNAFAKAATFRTTVKPLSPSIKAAYLFPYDSWESRIATHRFVRDIPLHAGHPSFERLKRIEGGLERLHAHPMQICWGLRDWCFDRHFLDGWRQRFPEARVMVYHDAGHYLLEDRGEDICRTVCEFFSAQP